MKQGADREARLIAAIEAVADAASQVGNAHVLHRARLATEHRRRRAEAIDDVATVTRTHGQTSVERSLAAIRAALLTPVDPSALDWSAFRFFEVADREIYWTRWFASILSPTSGATSKLVWNAICNSIVEQNTEPTICDEVARGSLATLENWRAAAHDSEPLLNVEREVHDPDLGDSIAKQSGFVDIAVQAPTMFVVIENKLDASWHDGQTKQAKKYRTFGLKHLESTRKLGLVVLTKQRDFPLDEFCTDYVRVSYWDLARHLRRGLQRQHADTSSIVWWPALLTIAAIEKDVYGLDIGRVADSARSWRALNRCNELADYLRVQEHQ